VSAIDTRQGGPDDNDAQAGHLVAHALRAADGHHGYSSPRGDGADNLLAFANTAGDTALGMSRPGVPPITTRNGDPGNVAGAFGVRRLTPLECERLQGFPDGWTEGESDSTRYRMLGNAVCVPVAEWIGRRILNSLETNLTKGTDG
jgi:DNA (cytosine-5)-methyltransferase 1